MAYIAGHEGSFSVEVKNERDWSPIAEAGSMQQAILRARSLFRGGETSDIRIVAELGNGRRRIHKVERMDYVPGNDNADEMTERARRRVSDSFTASTTYRLALMVGLGIAAGLFGLICIQIIDLVGQLRV